MFRGFTLQTNNVLDLNGQNTDTTTLGEDVSAIFNREFFMAPTDMDKQRGVPLSASISAATAPAFSAIGSTEGASRRDEPGAIRRMGRALRARDHPGARASSIRGASRSCGPSRCSASAAAMSIASTRAGRRKATGEFDFRFNTSRPGRLRQQIQRRTTGAVQHPPGVGRRPVQGAKHQDGRSGRPAFHRRDGRHRFLQRRSG